MAHRTLLYASAARRTGQAAHSLNARDGAKEHGFRKPLLLLLNARLLLLDALLAPKEKATA